MKLLLTGILFCIFSLTTIAQPGQWTWINGDNVPNQPGSFGTMGVASPANRPAGMYQVCNWTDNNGNFWLFGGLSGAFSFGSALWKFDVSTGMWTWVKGSSATNNNGSYGVKGVPSITNMPPCRSYGSATWTDLNGDLWLFGGQGMLGTKNDLWKYEIATNTWTWMSGTNLNENYGTYGTQGVPSINNVPMARAELCGTWVDQNNNLWLFGGARSDTLTGNTGSLNDLWKYNISTNEWTWMSGVSTYNASNVYGTQGVPSANNHPSGRSIYSRWVDTNNNLWFYGGADFGLAKAYSDMWKWDMNLSQWAWMGGMIGFNNGGSYGTQCDTISMSNRPASHYENAACWTDDCGRFWMFGGRALNGNNGGDIGDLWFYDVPDNRWVLAFGGFNLNNAYNYGTMGVPSPTNDPGARFGVAAFINNNNLYLWGGAGPGNFQLKNNDLWKYVINPACAPPCPQANALPVATFLSSDSVFCEKQCIDFTDMSTNNPISWQWTFTGGSPASSTLQNPAGICYNNYGTFDVTLIACNAFGCDTITLIDFIKEYPNPVDSIWQSNDTLYSLPGATYQWYETSAGAIPGAVNQYFVTQIPGNYFCVISDSIGCIATSNAILITGIFNMQNNSQQFSFYPNPNDGKFVIETKTNTTFEVQIINALGQEVYASAFNENRTEINLNVPEGLYCVIIKSKNNTGLIEKLIIKK